MCGLDIYLHPLTASHQGGMMAQALAPAPPLGTGQQSDGGV